MLQPNEGVKLVAGGVFSVFLLVALGSLVLFIVAIVDLVRQPKSAWDASGQNQLVWALVIVFVSFIGPLLYLFIARPALQEATRVE